MKTIIKGIILLLLLAGVIFLAYKFDLFPKRTLKIDKTVNVVDEVQKIGEFSTACYYEEVVVKNTKSSEINNSYWGSLVKADFQDQLVVIARGKVKAGFDLTKLGKDDLVVRHDTISVNLPPVEVFDVIVNPSDYEVYVEDGTWSHDEVAQLTASGKDQILQDAKNFNILQKAEENGLVKLKELFVALGFNEVILNVQKVK